MRGARREEETKRMHQVVPELVSPMLGGMATCLLFYPLECIEARLQVSAGKISKPRFVSSSFLSPLPLHIFFFVFVFSPLPLLRLSISFDSILLLLFSSFLFSSLTTPSLSPPLSLLLLLLVLHLIPLQFTYGRQGNGYTNGCKGILQRLVTIYPLLSLFTISLFPFLYFFIFCSLVFPLIFHSIYII